MLIFIYIVFQVSFTVAYLTKISLAFMTWQRTTGIKLECVVGDNDFVKISSGDGTERRRGELG